jgi:NAD-dependent DNA ligase
VGIARALASNSDIMLMGEAFSALDPLIRTDMQDLLLELQKELQKTIITKNNEIAQKEETIRDLTPTTPKDETNEQPGILDTSEKFNTTPDGEVTMVQGLGKDAIGAVDIGKNQKARAGMIFEVFRGDEKKGRLQLSKVNENSSIFRILDIYDEKSPIIEGDKIHSPFFQSGVADEFVVIGEFPAPFSRERVISQIENWGGSVAEKITSNTKYVVIGEGTITQEEREALQLYSNVERISMGGLEEFLGEQ